MKSHIGDFSVEIDNQSDNFALLALQGPESESRISAY